MNLDADSAKLGSSKVPTLDSILEALARFESPSQVVPDVLHEAGLQYKKTHNVPTRDWMYGRTRTRCINVLRKWKLENKTISIDNLPSEIIAHEGQPDEEAIAHELDHNVTQIVMSLENNMREAFTLWFRRFTGKEIAKMLGISEVNVRQLRFQVAGKVSRTLKSLEADDGG